MGSANFASLIHCSLPWPNTAVQIKAGKKLAAAYYEEEQRRRSAAKPPTPDEARRIAANVAELLKSPEATSPTA